MILKGVKILSILNPKKGAGKKAATGCTSCCGCGCLSIVLFIAVIVTIIVMMFSWAVDLVFLPVKSLESAVDSLEQLFPNKFYGQIYLAEETDKAATAIEDYDFCMYMASVYCYFNSVAKGETQFYDTDILDDPENFSIDDLEALSLNIEKGQNERVFKTIAVDFMECFYTDSDDSSAGKTSKDETTSKKDKDSEAEKTKNKLVAITDKDTIFANIEKKTGQKLSARLKNEIIKTAEKVREKFVVSDDTESAEENSNQASSEQSEVTESDTGEQKNPE